MPKGDKRNNHFGRSTWQPLWKQQHTECTKDYNHQNCSWKHIKSRKTLSLRLKFLQIQLQLLYIVCSKIPPNTHSWCVYWKGLEIMTNPAVTSTHSHHPNYFSSNAISHEWEPCLLGQMADDSCWSRKCVRITWNILSYQIARKLWKITSHVKGT